LLLKSLAARLYGVIRHPRATFSTILRAPSWAPVLAATTAVTFLCAIAFLRTEIGQQALVDQWERTAAAFGQPVDDQGYAKMEQTARSGGFEVLYAAITALANGPVLVFAISGLLFVALKRRAEGTPAHPRPSFVQMLAMVAHAGVVLALRQIVATPIEYIRESIGSPTTLVQLFSMLDETSTVARFLAIIDMFVIWWIVLLAVGLSVLYQRSTRRLVLALTGAYIALALLAALAMAVSGGTT
jgi:Yip1-like protein